MQRNREITAEVSAGGLSPVADYKMRKGMGSNFDFDAGKIENLIGVIGGWFVVLSIGYILYTSIGRLLSPVPLDPGPLAMGAVVMRKSLKEKTENSFVSISLSQKSVR